MVRRDRRPASPFELLGLPESADRSAVLAARRRLAKSVHPDHGGDASRMQRVNDATTAALDAIERRAMPSLPGREERPSPTPAPAGRPSVAPRPAGGRVVDDIPSFVVEALPAVAFDVLETVAPLLGTIADSEPPYLLDVELEGAAAVPVPSRAVAGGRFDVGRDGARRPRRRSSAGDRCRA
ncbi:MAG: J domain-containing protein [Ilumatobacteraceae bacterium]